MKVTCKFDKCDSSVEIDEQDSKVNYLCKKHLSFTTSGDARFQHYCFDPTLGGTDPKFYEISNHKYEKEVKEPNWDDSDSAPTDWRREALVGHENEKEILELLELDVRNYNE